MSSEPPPRFSSSGNHLAAAQRVDLRRQADLRHLQLVLQRLGERLVGLGPRRQADRLDVRVHRLGDGLVHVPRPRRAEKARRHLGVGHHRRGLGHRVADLPQLLDVRVVGFAEVVPDARVGRHDVGLIAAVGDDVVRALLQAEVLAAEIPADVHQLHRVERRASAPRRAGRVRALAFEGVFDRHHAVAGAVAPAHLHVRADVREDRDVDVLEGAGAHVNTPSSRAALPRRPATAAACPGDARAP